MSWNRQESKNEKGKSKHCGGRSRVPLVLLVPVVLLLLGVAAWWVAMPRGDNAAPQPKAPRGGGIITEAKPSAQSAAGQLQEEEKTIPHSNIPPEQQVMHTNMYGYVINPPHTAIVITNKVDDGDRPIEERIFTNSADQKIAGLLLLKPGEMLIGDPSSLFGRGFTRAFLKSLEAPIIIGKDDDEATADLKRAVIDSKIEIKARYDAGEDIGKLMTEEYNELQSLGLFREELKDQIAKLARDKSLGNEDMEDFIKAANIMLEARGGSPLQMPRFAARRFLLERQRNERIKTMETHSGDTKDD